MSDIETLLARHRALIASTVEQYKERMDTYFHAGALEAVIALADACNKLIEVTQPWKLAKAPAISPARQWACFPFPPTPFASAHPHLPPPAPREPRNMQTEP